VARRWQGVLGEHRWGPGEAPDKKSGDRAHRGGRATVGRREMAGAAAFNGGGVAPVIVDQGGWVLQLEGDPGVRRRQSIEGKCSSEGRSPEGANGGDARTESGVELGDGDECTVLRHGRTRRTVRGVKEIFGRWAAAPF
jgi:hypothetical protein